MAIAGMPEGTIWIIAGERGVGKSSFCLRVASLARQAGWKVSGLLSLAQFEQGEKIAILAHDLLSRENRLLAKLHSSSLSISGPRLGNWQFDSNTLAWGNELLKVALPCDLLVVDELGPLEFDQGIGWTSGFSALGEGLYKFAMVVIRPEYLPQAHARWRYATTITLTR